MSPHLCCATRLAQRQKQLFTEASLSQSCLRHFTTTPPARAGHNKWSKTKHIKAVTDKKKNTERTAFAKQLALYSKMYGENLTFNPQLASTVAAATKASVPKTIIEGAIARGQGRSLTGTKLEPVTFEAIMPPNIAIIAECETDNKTRTLSDIRHDLKKAGGVASSSAFFFTKRGRVTLRVKNNDEPGPTLSEMLDESIEHEGVEDIDEHADGGFVVWTEPSHLSAVARSIADKMDLEIVGLDMMQVPNADTVVALDSPEQARELGTLLTAFADYPETRAIYVNVRQGSVPQEAWEDVERHIDV